MTEPHPALARHTAALLDLAEGRTDPGDWLTWWHHHRDELAANCSRGVFLRLKRGADDLAHSEPTAGARTSQDAACHALDQLGVPYTRSDRYQNAWQRTLDGLAADPDQPTPDHAPVIAALAERFPRFAAFLTDHPDLIDECTPGVDDTTLDHEEHLLGRRLPAAYRDFRRRVGTLTVNDTLHIATTHPFRHHDTPDRVCIAEFWLYADGDQVIVELTTTTPDDPPVHHYDHHTGHTHLIAPTFTHWVESLPDHLGDD